MIIIIIIIIIIAIIIIIIIIISSSSSSSSSNSSSIIIIIRSNCAGIVVVRSPLQLNFPFLLKIVYHQAHSFREHRLSRHLSFLSIF